MLALALVGLLAFQGPGDVQKDKQNNSSSSSLSTWNDRVARQKVKAFEKALKKKKPSMAVRKQALDELVGGKSPHLIKPLQKFIETDHSVVLKRQAVEMLAVQPKQKTKKAVLELLKNLKVSANPQVQAGLVRALGRAGYEHADWKKIDEIFEEDYDPERIPVHEAILELVKKHKEAQAIPMLLRNMDQPSPDNVDAADNPPAEYWKARWQSWNSWKGKVKDALFALTGQKFANAEEAKAWLRKNPVKNDKGNDKRKGKGRRRR